MHKIIFLDWSGPMSNARSTYMPHCVDPIAVDLIHKAAKAGWFFVLSSDVREQFNSSAEAEEWMKERGVNIRFWDEQGDGWRTPPQIAARTTEIAMWMQANAVPDDAIFVVIDDMYIDREFMKRCRMNQINANSTVGIDYLSLMDGHRWFQMTDAQLEVEFCVEDEDSAADAQKPVRQPHKKTERPPKRVVDEAEDDEDWEGEE
jgi:hypothetical protein